MEDCIELLVSFQRVKMNFVTLREIISGVLDLGTGENILGLMELSMKAIGVIGQGMA